MWLKYSRKGTFILCLLLWSIPENNFLKFNIIFWGLLHHQVCSSDHILEEKGAVASRLQVGGGKKVISTYLQKRHPERRKSAVQKWGACSWNASWWWKQGSDAELSHFINYPTGKYTWAFMWLEHQDSVPQNLINAHIIHKMVTPRTDVEYDRTVSVIRGKSFF